MATVVAIHEGDNQNFDVVRFCGFSEAQLRQYHPISWSRIDHPYPPATDKDSLYPRAIENIGKKLLTRQKYLEGGFDALILSTRFDLISIMTKLVPLLNSSRPIVIFSPSKEVLSFSFDDSVAAVEGLHVFAIKFPLHQHSNH